MKHMRQSSLSCSFMTLILITVACFNFSLQDKQYSSQQSTMPQLELWPTMETIIKQTQNYSYSSFNNVVQGLPYPEHIQVLQNEQNQIIFNFRNLSNQSATYKPLRTIAYEKLHNSTCQSALDDIDYFGYFTGFPFYRIVTVCSNDSHEAMYTLRAYSSGDFDIIRGQTLKLQQFEIQNFVADKLKVASVYNNTYNTDRRIYKNYISKKKGGLNQGSYYKLYEANKLKYSKIKYQQKLQIATGLNNLSISSLELGIEEGGYFNAFISNRYGLYVTSSRGEQLQIEARWNPNQQQKNQILHKVSKICWNNTLAVLSTGNGVFISFIQLQTIYQTSQAPQIKISNIRKSSSLFTNDTLKAEDCQFFTIGFHAVCAIYTNNVSLWHIVWIDGNQINLRVQKFKGKGRPVFVEDLCSTCQFYQSNFKYQISTEYPEYRQQKYYKLISYKPKIIGQLIDFIEIDASLNSILFVTTTSTPKGYVSYCIKQNCTEQYTSGWKIQECQLFVQPASLNNGKNLNKIVHCLCNQYYPSSQYYSNFYHIFATSLDNKYLINQNAQQFKINISAFSFLNYQRDYQSNSYISKYIGKSSIQRDAYCQINFNSGSNPMYFVYGYEFESKNFEQCVLHKYSQVGRQNTKILMYRVDKENDNYMMTVQRIGFRFNKTYVLQDTVYISDIDSDDLMIGCQQYGLSISSKKRQRIILLDENLGKITDISASFDSTKFTNSFILLGNDNEITIKSMSGQSIMKVQEVKLENVLVNKNSAGFLDLKTGTYYKVIQNSQ